MWNPNSKNNFGGDSSNHPPSHPNSLPPQQKFKNYSAPVLTFNPAYRKDIPIKLKSSTPQQPQQHQRVLLNDKPNTYQQQQKNRPALLSAPLTTQSQFCSRPCASLRRSEPSSHSIYDEDNLSTKKEQSCEVPKDPVTLPPSVEFRNSCKIPFLGESSSIFEETEILQPKASPSVFDVPFGLSKQQERYYAPIEAKADSPIYSSREENNSFLNESPKSGAVEASFPSYLGNQETSSYQPSEQYIPGLSPENTQSFINDTKMLNDLISFAKVFQASEPVKSHLFPTCTTTGKSIAIVPPINVMSSVGHCSPVMSNENLRDLKCQTLRRSDMFDGNVVPARHVASNVSYTHVQQVWHTDVNRSPQRSPLGRIEQWESDHRRSPLKRSKSPSTPEILLKRTCDRTLEDEHGRDVCRTSEDQGVRLEDEEKLEKITTEDAVVEESEVNAKDALFKMLENCRVESEEDAEVVLQVVSSLLKSFLRYKLRPKSEDQIESLIRGAFAGQRSDTGQVLKAVCGLGIYDLVDTGTDPLAPDSLAHVDENQCPDMDIGQPGECQTASESRLSQPTVDSKDDVAPPPCNATMAPPMYTIASGNTMAPPMYTVTSSNTTAPPMYNATTANATAPTMYNVTGTYPAMTPFPRPPMVYPPMLPPPPLPMLCGFTMEPPPMTLFQAPMPPPLPPVPPPPPPP